MAASTFENESIDSLMTDSNTTSRDSSVTDPASAEGTKKHKTMSPTIDYGSFEFVKEKILQPVDDEVINEIGSYTWHIDEFKTLTEDKERSPVFNIGGWDFNILIFPKGNANSNLALYLEPQPKKVKDAESGEMVPENPKWYVCAQFTLIISNPKDPKNHVVNTSQQRFCRTATDWGFSNFIDLRSLYQKRTDGSPSLLFDDKLNITAFVKVLRDPTGVLWHSFADYDSKKETGYVGFINQGATCYLNSLLQSYYFTNCFRNAVYQIPSEGEDPKDSLPLALQKVFYKLQCSDVALDTSELTKSFGWDGMDAFQQHDVQEMNRILMEKLEERMKNTSVENMLNETFVGKMKSYIKCINVDYESSRVEDFWDIQLNVKGMANLHQSFQNYVEVETLEGENQYAAQDFGLQDAEKGVAFVELPDVLHLQLKRVEVDFESPDLDLRKVNDRYEFSETIDLSPFLAKSEDKETEPCIYDLHGVLVHQGDPRSGHYYAMMRPDKSDTWFRFDDERVWRVTKRQAIEENYGVDEIPPEQIFKMTNLQKQAYWLRRHTSAYMLVYMKRSAVDKILVDVPNESVPKYISHMVESELEEESRKRKELEELHLYLNLNFYTDGIFKRYEGFDLAADRRVVPEGLYDKGSFPYTIKALKTRKFSELYPEIKELTGVDPKEAFFWTMSYRRNQTLRPNAKLADVETLTVEEVYDKFFSKKHLTANFWLEEPSKELFEGVSANSKPIESIQVDQDVNLIESTKLLLFLKHFDAESQSLKGVAHFYANEEDSADTLTSSIKKALGISDEYELEFFEEVNNGSIEKVNQTLSLYKCELGNGDILTVQKSTPKGGDLLEIVNKDNVVPFYTSAEQYYLYLGTRRHINIQPLASHNRDDEFVIIDKNGGDTDANTTFDMWISSHAPYFELAQRVAKKINKDPKHLRIYVNYSGQRTAMRSNMHVGNFLPKGLWQSSLPLFEYELLNAPLVEIEQMASIKLHWVPSGYCHYTDHEILINSNSTVGDLVNKLQTKIGFSDKDKESVMIWSCLDSKFSNIIAMDADVSLLEDESEVFGAILPEEAKLIKELYMNDGNDESTPEREATSSLTPVIQFYKDPRNMHGISFIFALYAGEPLKETKARLQKKMGLGQREFAKVKICVWNTQRRSAEYIENDDIELFEIVPNATYLCLDTPDRTSRTGAAGAGGISIR